MVKITIKEEWCVGCELCIKTAPKAFALGSDGFVVVKKEAEISDKVKEAEYECPTDSIEIEED